MLCALPTSRALHADGPQERPFPLPTAAPEQLNPVCLGWARQMVFIGMAFLRAKHKTKCRSIELPHLMVLFLFSSRPHFQLCSALELSVGFALW